MIKRAWIVKYRDGNTTLEDQIYAEDLKRAYEIAKEKGNLQGWDIVSLVIAYADQEQKEFRA